jgi:(R,R)-butanediol dehydrogenase/meso-butanediol dehydrogenase/diacetyl reductase
LRVALFHGPGLPITVEEAPEPRPARDEVVIKICRCGVCGSDLSMTAADTLVPYPTGAFGHEFAGEVVEVGRDVSGLKAGDRVASPPLAGCGECEACRRGALFFCKSPRVMFGGFGEYLAIPASSAITLPRSLSMADGALVEPMACGLHALNLARVQGGERMVVLGAGAMALSMVYWGRRLGLGRIVVASRSAHRQEVLRAMGADAVVALDAEDPNALAGALGGEADIVAECVGKPGLLSRALAEVRTQGTVLSLGMCMHGETVAPALCAFKEVRLLFPHGYTFAEYVQTAKAFEADDLSPDLMVSDVIALESLPETLEALRAGRKSLKVHVDPSLPAPRA